MKVYYGVVRKSYAEKVNYPMISVRTMLKRETPITENKQEWFLDSGAYTFLKDQGQYPFTYGKYLQVVSRFNPTHWANMDWCCEPTVLKSTGLSVLQHIANTVESGRQLIDFDRNSFVMVLQGWSVRDYLTCVDYCKDNDLITHVLGIGSICGRTDPREVFDILNSIKAAVPDGCKIHCFGTSINLLKYKEIFDRIDSIDTWAWSREFGLTIMNGVSSSMRIDALLKYQKKVGDIILHNDRQSLLSVDVVR